MKKSISVFFGVDLGGFQARDTLYEKVDVVVDERKTFVKGSSGNEISKGSAFGCI